MIFLLVCCKMYFFKLINIFVFFVFILVDPFGFPVFWFQKSQKIFSLQLKIISGKENFRAAGGYRHVHSFSFFFVLCFFLCFVLFDFIFVCFRQFLFFNFFIRSNFEKISLLSLYRACIILTKKLNKGVRAKCPKDYNFRNQILC